MIQLKKDFLYDWRIIIIEVYKMLIDTSMTIAYKCPSCGTFEFISVSLFKILNTKESSLLCRCGNSSISVSYETSDRYRLIFPCISCGSDHIFILSKKEMLCKEINIFSCPETGMQQCFIGNDMRVRQKVDNLEKELDELINMFGYDNYFKNTQVMFDSLNKIHDIAEQGNLCCECGNDDIELTLLSDKIQLTCKKCPASRVIYAASNEDLKEILTKQQIVLLGEFSGYESKEPFMRKTDGK